MADGQSLTQVVITNLDKDPLYSVIAGCEEYQSLAQCPVHSRILGLASHLALAL